MRRILLSFAAVVVLVAFSVGTRTVRGAQMTKGGENEKVFHGEVYDSACAKQGTHEQMKKQAGVKTDRECTLKCVEMGSKLVLYNPKTKKTHELDDQDKAKEFAGERVTVSGSLDTASNTIHIEKIEAAGGHKGAKEKKQG